MKSRFYVIPGLASVPGAPFGNLAITKPVLAPVFNWTPASLGSALNTFYLASTGVTSAGGTVSAFAPKSGPGPTLAQATSGNQPLLASVGDTHAVVPGAEQSYLQGNPAGLGITDSTPFSMVVFLQVDTSVRNLFSDVLWFGEALDKCLRIGFPSSAGGAIEVILSGSHNIADPSSSLVLKTSLVPANGSTLAFGITYDGTGKASGTKLYANGALDSVTVSDAYTLGSTSLNTGSFTLGSSYNGNTWAKDAVVGLFTATRVMTADEMNNASRYFGTL